MENPKFRQFDNEEGTYSIVYDLNGKNETVVGVTGKRDVALNSVRELNKILYIERERLVGSSLEELKRLAHEALPDSCVKNWEEVKFCENRQGDGNACKRCSNYLP